MTRPDANTWQFTMSFLRPDRPGPDGTPYYYHPGTVVVALIDRIGPWAVVSCPALGAGVALIAQCRGGWYDPDVDDAPLRSYRAAVAEALTRLQPWQTVHPDVVILPIPTIRLVIVRRVSDAYTAIVGIGVAPGACEDDGPVGLVWNPDTDGAFYECDMSTPEHWIGALGVAGGGG